MKRCLDTFSSSYRGIFIDRSFNDSVFITQRVLNKSLVLYKKHIILFDGDCRLCNKSIDFIIRRDSKRKFLFASLQSDIAKSILKDAHLQSMPVPMTIFLVEGENYYIRSTGVLRIAKELHGLSPLLYVFIIVPPFIRNYFYNIVGKYRYKWFGKMNTCRVMTSELKERFLDQG